jgi:hypothetical protein
MPHRGPVDDALLAPRPRADHCARVKFRLKRRVKKMNVCTRCEATMDRRTAIPEGAGRRYWGDVEPYVYVGDAEIHHFICTSCGNLTAIQFREAA